MAIKIQFPTASHPLNMFKPMKTPSFALALVFASVSAFALVGRPTPPTVPPTVSKPGCNKSGGSSKPSNKPANKPAPKKSAPARK